MSGENEGWEPPENNISEDLQFMRKLGKSVACVRTNRTLVPSDNPENEIKRDFRVL